MGDDGMYEGLTYLKCNAENGFVPELPSEPVDIIYLCYPNNPTGTTLTKDQLKVFVDYARENKAIILFCFFLLEFWLFIISIVLDFI